MNLILARRMIDVIVIVIELKKSRLIVESMLSCNGNHFGCIVRI